MHLVRSTAAFVPVYPRVFEISIFHFRVVRYSRRTNATTERVGICNTCFRTRRVPRGFRFPRRLYYIPHPRSQRRYHQLILPPSIVRYLTNANALLCARREWHGRYSSCKLQFYDVCNLQISMRLRAILLCDGKWKIISLLTNLCSLLINDVAGKRHDHYNVLKIRL